MTHTSNPKAREAIAEIEIHYAGAVPSKSNFRKGGKDWRKKWERIKTFQEELGWRAVQAGTRPMYSKMPVEVHATLINQRLDVDNSGKAILDALEGVCFDNDKQVVRWAVEHVNEEGVPRLTVTVRWLYQRDSHKPGEAADTIRRALKGAE